jgi:uncharacterized membrane protein
MIDLLRVFAIVLMIIFHFSYDMTLFKWFEIDFRHDPFWFYLPRLIVFLFLLCMGMSMQVNFQGKINWRSVRMRFVKIFGFALLVSLTTFFMFPKNWVYFGTLHCIAFCSVLAIPLLGRPKWALCVFLLMFCARFVLHIKLNMFPWEYFGSIKSVDYIPVYPWFLVVCLGMFLPLLGFHKWWPFPRAENSPGVRRLEQISRQSLWIYLLHQPILFGSLFLIHKVFGN